MTEAAPVCGICKNQMTRLSRTTSKLYLGVFVCNTGLPNKAPCDGFAYRIATDPNTEHPEPPVA